MSTFLENTMSFFGFVILFIMIMGFVDVLWIFGVENSKEYTWWYLMHLMAN